MREGARKRDGSFYTINLKEIRKIRCIFMNQDRIVMFAVLQIKSYRHLNGTKTKAYLFFLMRVAITKRNSVSEVKIFRLLTSPI